MYIMILYFHLATSSNYANCADYTGVGVAVPVQTQQYQYNLSFQQKKEYYN